VSRLAVTTPVEELFGETAERLLAAESGVARDRIFHSAGLRTAGGKFFAFVVRGELVVKLPAERVDELVRGGAGRPFESGSRVMRAWVRVSPTNSAACEAYVLEAQSFVAALASR
jgi:hypothetical protein